MGIEVIDDSPPFVDPPASTVRMSASRTAGIVRSKGKLHAVSFAGPALSIVLDSGFITFPDRIPAAIAGRTCAGLGLRRKIQIHFAVEKLVCRWINILRRAGVSLPDALVMVASALSLWRRLSSKAIVVPTEPESQELVAGILLDIAASRMQVVPIVGREAIRTSFTSRREEFQSKFNAYSIRLGNMK